MELGTVHIRHIFKGKGSVINYSLISWNTARQIREDI